MERGGVCIVSSNQPLISIIVPIFNVEQYLSKCIESLLNQTYKNLEIILSDDGSTDNSALICDHYAVHDSRIKVIHKKNGGLSDARNAGLDMATGEYIAFIDSDDYFELDAIETLVMIAIKYDTSITHMKNYIVSSDYLIVENQSFGTRKVSICTSEKYIQGMCEKRKSESVCDKLFKSELFSERRFEKGRLNEDFLFLSKILFTDLKIAEVDYSGYNYYQRPGSITNSGYGKSLVDAVKNAYELKELAHIKNPKLEKYFARLTLFQARTLFIVIPWENVRENKNDYIDSLYYLRKSLPFVKEAHLSMKDKLIVLAIGKMPKLTIRLLGKIWMMKNS